MNSKVLSCIKHQKVNTSTSLKQSHKSKPHLFAHVMGNRYSKLIQIYKTTKLIITWYTCVILFTDSSVYEPSLFCKLSYNTSTKVLENTYWHVSVRANTKVKTRPQTKKTKFRIYFSTSLPWKEVVILTDVYAASQKKQ